MNELGIEMARSEVAYSVEEALSIADRLGYPVVLRPAYTMGGAGGGLVYNVDELKTVCARGLQASLVGQVLVEESILGWEELELEIVRDCENNTITVCFIENIDPSACIPAILSVPPLCSPFLRNVRSVCRSRLIKSLKAFRLSAAPTYSLPMIRKPTASLLSKSIPGTSRSSALASKATGFPYRPRFRHAGLRPHPEGYPCGKYGTLDKYVPDGDYAVIKFARWAFENSKA